MTIKLIEHNSPSLLKITLEEGEVFVVRENFFAKGDFFPLSQGQFISKEQILILQRAALTTAAFLSATNLLARAEQTRAGLTRKLLKKSFKRENIYPALDFLEERGLLCDERFAKLYASSKDGKVSGAKLLSLLAKHGVCLATARRVVASCHSDNAELLSCATAAQKFKKTGRAGQKLVASLRRSGFSYSTIKQVIKKNDEIIFPEQDAPQAEQPLPFQISKYLFHATTAAAGSSATPPSKSATPACNSPAQSIKTPPAVRVQKSAACNSPAPQSSNPTPLCDATTQQFNIDAPTNDAAGHGDNLAIPKDSKAPSSKKTAQSTIDTATYLDNSNKLLNNSVHSCDNTATQAGDAVLPTVNFVNSTNSPVLQANDVVLSSVNFANSQNKKGTSPLSSATKAGNTDNFSFSTVTQSIKNNSYSQNAAQSTIGTATHVATPAVFQNNTPSKTDAAAPQFSNNQNASNAPASNEGTL